MPEASPDPPTASCGAAPERAPLAVVLIHGRARTAEEMIGLAVRIALPHLAWRAPAVAGGSWYPQSFMAPDADNQPALGLALDRIEREVRALEAVGLPRRRIALIGFSQGACVACEYVRRHPTRWGALIAFTGGLAGPDGTIWTEPATLDGTPVLFSAGDEDALVPWSRVEESAVVFTRMGAAVTLRRYPGGEHLVDDDEIREARAILAAAASQAFLETNP